MFPCPPNLKPAFERPCLRRRVLIGHSSLDTAQGQGTVARKLGKSGKILKSRLKPADSSKECPTASARGPSGRGQSRPPGSLIGGRGEGRYFLMRTRDRAFGESATDVAWMGEGRAMTDAAV